MLLTLRLAGLGFEIDAAKREKSNESECVRAMQNIGFLDVIHYGFSYMGILTGKFLSNLNRIDDVRDMTRPHTKSNVQQIQSWNFLNLKTYTIQKS